MEKSLKHLMPLIAGVVVIVFTVIMTTTIIINNKNYPFRCSGFTHYDLSRKEGKPFDFFLTQDLRFQDNNGGYLLFNGNVIKEGTKSYLSRTINFGEGKKVDGDTYRYHIIGVKISPSDNASSVSFNQLLSEFTSDPTVIQLDVIRLQGETFLIGGPVSYLFTCIRY